MVASCLKLLLFHKTAAMKSMMNSWNRGRLIGAGIGLGYTELSLGVYRKFEFWRHVTRKAWKGMESRI